MRSSGLCPGLGLLTDLSRSQWDLTSVMGLGFLESSDYPRSGGKCLLGCISSAGQTADL